ncbi:MAG: S8 family peptidase [Elusimicrobia bacterium]|nr:S8 family peptidase [Elusimicrobiota bacterium]
MRNGWWLGIVLSLSAPQAEAAAAKSAKEAASRLIVALRPGADAAQARRLVEAQGLRVVDEIPGAGVLLAELPGGPNATVESKLLRLAEVRLVGPDVWRDDWLSLGAGAEDPLALAQQSLRALPKFSPRPVRPAGQEDPQAPAAEELRWGVRRVNAPAAWSAVQGQGVKVAVIDTGIDPEVPDLKARVAGGVNAIDDKAPWVDDHFHGTHVAGIVAAELDGAGVAGVAPKAALYAVKVLTKEGSGDLFGIMRGVIWTAQNGIDVANMSLGAPQEIPLLQYALQMAANAGVTVIAAAGNDGKAVNWPAAYPEAVAVSALCPPGVANAKLCPTAEEGIATFSSRGPEVDFIAPGVLIPSTVPASNDPSYVKAYSGTSMACPHVAGLAALAVARGAKGPDAVRAALTRAAGKLPGLSDAEQGAGLVDAARLR